MFSWVTDLEVTPVNAQRLARARWRIENETFNVMKNRGYHLEHNYGHGYANLSTLLLLLMFLAVLTDQIQEAFCPLFGAALKSFEQ